MQSSNISDTKKLTSLVTRSEVTRRRFRPMTFTKTHAIVVMAVLSGLSAAAALSPQIQAQVHRRLGAALEQRIQRTIVDDWAAVTGIVVACGNMSRIDEGLRLAYAYPHLRFAVTGCGKHELAMVTAAKDLSNVRLLIEPAALNTFENAWRSKKLISPQPRERWLLVTSATHMPRAISSFHSVGFHIDPWPVQDTNYDPKALADVVQHEWFGLIAYWLKGRTRWLFPAQQDLEERTEGPYLCSR